MSKTLNHTPNRPEMENIEINLRITPRALTLEQFQALTAKALDQGIGQDEFILNAILDKLEPPPAKPVRRKPIKSIRRRTNRKGVKP